VCIGKCPHLHPLIRGAMKRGKSKKKKMRKKNEEGQKIKAKLKYRG
jgi:hypothetical protein